MKKLPKFSIFHEPIPGEVLEMMALTRLAEVGRASASVAHDINNALMVAQGQAENIEFMLEQENLSKSDIEFSTKEIIKACGRITNIVKNMRAMSLSTKLKLETVSAEVLLNKVLTVMAKQFEPREVKVQKETDRPIEIRCDLILIEQVILNMFSNSLNYLDQLEEGLPRLIRIRFDQVAQMNQIAIWNNGPSISPEVQEQILNPFLNPNEDPKKNVGLVLSKAIMHVHGGHLGITPDLTSGAEFVLSFPTV